jgi:hypothetical protein
MTSTSGPINEKASSEAKAIKNQPRLYDREIFLYDEMPDVFEKLSAYDFLCRHNDRNQLLPIVVNISIKGSYIKQKK